MNRLIVNIFLFCIGAQTPTLAQYINPSPGSVFGDESVGRIDILIDTAYLNIVLQEGNEQSDEEYPATVIIETDDGADTLTNIGFRLRGNTSRYSQKKSFKISINSFEQGRDYKGLEKLNINGEHNDPSIIRAKLCWDLMAEAGALASRSRHTEFYINEEYKGLYIHVEHIDEEYIEERFGNKNGNLYKCLYPADLVYLGSDPNEYKFESNGRRAYELKINEEVDDYSGLAHFIDVLNNTPDATFISEIEKVLHLESYLRALAVETLIAHWDNYSVNQNNFYLYENPADGLFYYIPYDLDNTLGVDWFDIDWAEFDIYNWFFENDNRPLAKRLMAIPKYYSLYSSIVLETLNSSFNSSILFPRIDEIKDQIQSSAEADVYRTLDWGFTIDDFNNSYNNRLDQFHVRYGLKEFISRREETAWGQLVITSVDKVDNSISVYPNPSSSHFTIDLTGFGHERVRLVIYDVFGRVISEENIQPTQYTWPTSDIMPGMYLLNVETNDAVRFTQKLLLK